jgi:diguanylate cyclase (GGDEF)-like protein
MGDTSLMEGLATSRVTRRRFVRDAQSNLGGILFVLAGLVTIGGMLAPHGEEVHERGLVLLSLGLVAVGVVLLVLPRRLAKRSPPYVIGVSIVSVTIGVHLNGERLGGTPLFNELFYFWPALFVGYFFSPRRTAVALLGIACGYALVLSQLPVAHDALLPRYVITMTSLVGTAVAMRVLRTHVDRLVTRLNELARTDVLTNLLNRRAFDERLALELDRARRTSEPFALLLGDIDHFKAINDRYGHPAGDDVIRSVAQILRDALREHDVPGRYGGEEFGILLPDTGAAGAEVLAERVRKRIEAAALSKTAVRATVSIGIAELDPQDMEYSVWISHADRALYAAKERGRNRSVRFQPSFPPTPEPT